MTVTVLAGGVGAARFLTGLVQALGSTDDDPSITVIGNTADDLRLFGLQVCPDLDSVMYTLGNGQDRERGWGRADESFTVLEELRAYGATPDWFNLGDRDFATHILRTQMLDAGYSLDIVTAALCQRWKVPVRLIPMSNDRVETHVAVLDPNSDEPVALHFQEWWVRHHAKLAAKAFMVVGVEDATPARGVLQAIAEADVVILPPSNPVVSIGPILQVPGIRDALAATSAPIIGVSPIVGGAPVRGMADACLSAIGVRTSAAAVAAHYGTRSFGGLLDGWVIDTRDQDDVARICDSGIRCVATDTMLDDPSVAQSVAEVALAIAADIRAGSTGPR
ncbi:MAG: 2-phospho-L-lactate transferase [Actinomycetes bacterium]